MLGTFEFTPLAQLMDKMTDGTILAWTLGWQEILVIVVVVLILFGGRKIPELARGIGRGMREFKREMRGVKEDLEEAMNEEEEEPRPRSKKKKRRPRPVEETDEADDTEDTSDDDKTA